MGFHWPGYQYMVPGTHLEKRLALGDPGINWLDRIAKAHDRKTLRERFVKNILKAKLKLGM